MSVDLLSEFSANIQTQQLLKPSDRVLVAVSSGPDSMALLHLLHRMASVELGIFHLNHQLRPEADEEAEYVAALGRQLGLPVYVYQYDVNRYCKEQQLSVEAGAREVRYRLMQDCLEKHGYTKIALGHHKDDQAETVLLHLIRGTGLAGLGGMKPIRDCYIRPLLPFTRRQIISYCDAFQITYYHDQTNFSTEYGRNKLRLELIPLIEAEYNPKFSQHLVQLAEIARADDEELAAQTHQLMRKLTFEQYGVLMLRRSQFQELSPAFQRRVLQSCIAQARRSVQWVAFNQAERLRQLILEQSHFTFELPLLTVIGEPKNIVFGRPRFSNWDQQELPVPGEIRAGHYHIKTEVFLCNQDYVPSEVGEDFDLEQLRLPLILRRRQPGDRMQVFGQTGSKKVKDLLIDAKVPQYLRDQIPLICDQDHIIWLGGIRRSEKGRITSTSRKILRIIFEVVKDCHHDQPML